MINFRCPNVACTSVTVIPERGMMKCPDCGAPSSVIDVLRSYAKRTGQWIIGGGTFAAVGHFRTDGMLGQALTAIGVLGLSYALFRVVRQTRILAQVKSTTPEEGS